MKIVQCEQGSADWYQARLGIPTASCFEQIVTPGGRLSAQARKYALRLVAEELLNRPLDSLDHVQWVQHGREHEPAAVKLYGFEQGCQTQPVGFCMTDDGRIGASPDRLVGASGLLEVKCPSPAVHLGYLLDGPGADYRPQVQGQLLVTEREWCDFWSYSPEMPAARVRSYREEEYIAKLRDALAAFCDMRDLLLDRARAAGVFQAAAEVRTPAEAELGQTPEGESYDPAADEWVRWGAEA